MSATFIDSSANNLPITNIDLGSGGVLYDKILPAVGSGDAVINNSSLTSPIIVSGPLDLSAGDFTVEFWLNDTNLAFDPSSGITLLGLGTDGSNGLSIYPNLVAAQPALTVTLYQTVGSTSINSNPLSQNPVLPPYYIQSGTWSHWAVVLAGTTFKLFYNGTLIASATISTRAAFVGGFGLGNNYSGSAATENGNVDELRISNVARYSANFTPSTQPSPLDANTMLLLHMDPLPIELTVQGKFVAPSTFSKAILTASAGTINPRIYPPKEDTTIVVPQQRLPI